MAGDITTQQKQGRQAVPMSSLTILSRLWIYEWLLQNLSKHDYHEADEGSIGWVTERTPLQIEGLTARRFLHLKPWVYFCLRHSWFCVISLSKCYTFQRRVFPTVHYLHYLDRVFLAPGACTINIVTLLP